MNHPFCGLPQMPMRSEAVSNFLTQSYVLDTLGGDDGHGGAEVKMYDVVMRQSLNERGNAKLVKAARVSLASC